MRKLNNLFRIVQDKTYGTVAAMFFMVATCSFFACSKDDDVPPVVSPYADSRTVMVYMVAENSLSGNVETDVWEMLQGMDNDTLKAGDRLVVYIDDVKLPRVYVVDKTTKKSYLSDLEPVLTYEEDVNSSSADQLAAFVDYATTHYPADSYGLVMWSHASGWIPSSYEGDKSSETVVRKSFGLDNGKNSSSKYLAGHQMDIADMVKALEGKSFDFIFFDACMMQNIEVAYEMRHVTKHIIASPAEIPSLGANYKTMTRAMMREDDYVEQMLAAYYNEYKGSVFGLVISAIDTEGLDGFATQMKSIVSAHRTELLSLNTSSVQNYFKYPTWLSTTPDFLDMQGVMLNVLDEAEYAEWKEQISKFITCRHAGKWYSDYPKKTMPIDDKQCCGVTMFIPFEKYTYKSFNDDYLATSWAQAVWME